MGNWNVKATPGWARKGFPLPDGMVEEPLWASPLRESTGHGYAYILVKEPCRLSWRAESPGKGITATFSKTTKEDRDVCKLVKPLFYHPGYGKATLSTLVITTASSTSKIVFFVASCNNSFSGKLIFALLLFFVF